MNNIDDENFKKNWKTTYKENQRMDSETDARILAGIQSKIKSGNDTILSSV